MSISEYRVYIKGALDSLLALAVNKGRDPWGDTFWDMVQAMGDEWARINCHV